MDGQVLQLQALNRLGLRSPAKVLLTGLLPLGLLFGNEAANAQPPFVNDVHVFLSPDGVFELAEPIWVIVYFDRALAVTGVPLLALTIGTQRRHASFVGMALASEAALIFRYTVAPSDYDADGVSIGADALTLNGGTIKSLDGASALLDLGSHTLSDTPFRTVDGRIESAPTVAGLLVEGPPGGDTFELAETISVWVWFNRAVAVTGVPQLALTIGAQTRYASFAATAALMPIPLASSPAFAARPVNFLYSVEASDHDEDGISIDANALTLNGGTIEVRGGSADAVLDIPSYHAISNSASHKVDGQRAGGRPGGNRPPRVVGELPDLELDVGETALVNAAAAFVDADGDRLRYSASSGSGFVSLATSAGTVRVRGVQAGEATVTVQAEDPAGLMASATFRVTIGAVLAVRSMRPAAPESGTVVFALELSRALTRPVVTRWRLAADSDVGTADADAADYLAAPAGQESIPARETSAIIEIAIADDANIEPAREHFVLQLESPEDENVALTPDAGAQAVIQEGVCDRTPAVRDELARLVRGCHWPDPAALAVVSTLNLSGRNIAALRSNDLLGLGGLRQLDLSANALQTLPAGLFTGIEGLREVSVEENPGAPFMLTIDLVRLDAEPWASGPARVAARTASAAPFGLGATLFASPTSAASGELPAEVAIAPGATIGEPFAVASNNGAALVIHADAAPLPSAQCGGRLCFRGFQTAPGPALALFRRPPRALALPTPEPLQGGDALRLPLASLAEAADPLDELRWEATSSNDALATARIVDGALEVTPELATAGTADIAVVATDTAGLSTTLRFEVRVAFHWPRGPGRGWRATLTRIQQPGGN